MIMREVGAAMVGHCKLGQIRRNDDRAGAKWALWPVVVVVILAVGLAGIGRVRGDAASDQAVLQAFKAGITNSDTLGWTGNDPCSWNSKQVVCDSAGNVLELRVRAANLTGTVIPTLNQLTSLTFLELNFNFFTGAMPTLSGLAALTQAYLDDNNFDTIPADFFDGLTSITEIWLDNNGKLNSSSGGWQLPSSLPSTLTLLSMNNVSATGSLPSYLGTMPKLTTFNAGYNSFTGPVPASFQTSGLQVLLLNNQNLNGLNGGVGFIGGMVGLTQLYLHGNSFTGPVPVGITSAAGLTSFRVSANQLVGRLPLGLGNLPGLTDVWVAGNYFDGEEPVFPANAFVTPTGQTSTYCAGPGVPCSTQVDALIDFLAAAGYPQAIAVTWIGSDPCTNKWSGVACDATTGDVTSIILSSAGLSGTLSPSLANLTSLTTLVVSGNNLTGPIPTQLTTLTSLQTVDVSNNDLSGPLPSFPSSVKFSYSGNPLLTASPPPATPPVTPPVAPPVTPPVAPPVTPPVAPPVTPPVAPPVTPPAAPPVTPPVTPPAVAPPSNPPTPAPVSPPPAPAIAPVIAPISAPAPVGTTPTRAPASGTPASAPAGGVSPAPGSSPAPTVVIPVTSQKSGGSAIGPVVGGVVGGIVVCTLGLWFLFLYYRKRKRNKATKNPLAQPGAPPSIGTTLDPEFVKIVVESGSTNGSRHTDGQAPEPWGMAFTIDQLRAVTEDFAERNVLGRGGFGVVYKGVLPDGTKIAVKRMEAAVVSNKGLSEFQSEIAVLSKVKHRHLVGLLGYCTDGIERLLVYEYMSQGTLAQHLFKYEEMALKPLSWTTRLVIALDVAQGVDYLHSLAHRSFIHRDLKPSNVLLNDDFRAKVSDFGLVKLAPEGNLHSVETRLAGTFGYLAPEYAVTGRVTTKADVFSFGVILMELLTGRRAVDESLPDEDMYLVTWFTTKMRGRQEGVLRSIIDPTMGDIDDETTLKSITTVVELAGHCTVREPAQRPDMGRVVSVLRPLVDEWKPMSMDYDADTSINDTEMSLKQAVKQWQEFKDDSTTSSTTTDSSSVNSLPARPRGFADSFASADGR